MNFFDIHSVAIIGVSEAQGKIGNDILKNMSDFGGDVYGINPKGGKYNDITFLKSISELPRVPDMAVFAIPAKYVADSLRECGEKGIKRVIIISAGFKEVGNLEAEQELVDIAKQYGIRLLGPNCLGYVDTSKNINLSFGGKDIRSGNIAMISQSGAMAVAFTDWAYEYGIGFSKIISMGNKADLSENDFMQELIDDNQTQVIALYLESIEQGKEFYQIAQKLSQVKPVVMIKSGMSDRGSAAAASHTGALATSADVLKTCFIQAGIHYTDTLEDFFLWSQAFSRTRNMTLVDEMVIVTNAGGPGVISTDHMDHNNIAIAEFSDIEKKILMKGLPDAASVKNPIDIIGDATSQRYEAILNNIASLDRDLAILVLLTPQTVTDVDIISEKIIDFKNAHPNRMIMVSFMGGHSLGNSREVLESAGVLYYDYPKNAIVTFSKLIQQRNWEAKKSVKNIEKINIKNLSELKNKLKRQEEKLCSTDLVGKILEAYDIESTKEYLVTSHQQIDEIYNNFSGPIVAKISSPDIAHKTDVGGIIVDIKTASQAIDAYDKILSRVAQLKSDAIIDGIVLQAQIPKSREIFVGLKRDPSFGDMLIVGRGGIYVNVYNDVERGLLPLGRNDIESMLNKLQIAPILNGVRGEKAINFTKLSDTIFRLSHLFTDLKQIKEIDINPILSNHENAIVVDAKFYL